MVAPKQPDVAAIYFPSWHDEPRRDAWLGDAFTEWDLIKAGKPRFEGHYQPIVPTLGYRDETVPAHMRDSCDMAKAAGIDAFLWDWYWYDGEDFLNRPLNDTFMTLTNPGVNFALMWANHDWVNAFPAHVGQDMELWWPGAIGDDEFTRMSQLIIERYLVSPNYWRPNDLAWFTIFRLNEFINGVGGLSRATALLGDFRARAQRYGVGGLHINAMGGYEALSSEEIAELGIDSIGTYGWTEQWSTTQPTQLTIDYSIWRDRAKLLWHEMRERQEVEVVPTVATGWDSSTRVAQDESLRISHWPFLPIVINNEPHLFGGAFEDAARFAAHNEKANVVIVNAWNEWTEGSYLEPSSKYGDGHLKALNEAIKNHGMQANSNRSIKEGDFL